MVVLITLGVVAWVLAALGSAWMMRRQGYDPLPWLVLGLLLAPTAVLLAFVELAWPAPYPPRVLAPGRVQSGNLDVLVTLGSSPGAVGAAADVLDHLRPRVRTLGLARVLPRGGARLLERQAADQLRSDAEALALPRAQLVLLFGRPEKALREYADVAGYSLVVAGEQPQLVHALRQRGLVAASGKAEVARILGLDATDPPSAVSAPARWNGRGHARVERG